MHKQNFLVFSTVLCIAKLVTISRSLDIQERRVQLWGGAAGAHDRQAINGQEPTSRGAQPCGMGSDPSETETRIPKPDGP